MSASIRDLQMGPMPESNTPCRHVPLRDGYCAACPAKPGKPSRQRVAEHRARKAAAAR